MKQLSSLAFESRQKLSFQSLWDSHMTKLFTVIEWASAYKLTNVQDIFSFFWGHMYLHSVYCKSHYPPEKESKLSAWCLKHTTHTNRLHPSTSLLYASTRSVQKKICVITHKTVLMHAQGQKKKKKMKRKNKYTSTNESTNTDGC